MTLPAKNSNLRREARLTDHNELYKAYLTTCYDNVEAEINIALPHVPGSHTVDDPIARIPRLITDANGQSVSVQHLVQQNTGVTVLAEEGVGKTFTMLSAFRDAILKRLDDPSAPLPIFARARRWNIHKAPPLADWLAAQSGLSVEIVNRLITRGDFVLIVDGLDDLLKKYPKAQHATSDPRQPFLEMLPQTGTLIVTTTPDDRFLETFSSDITVTIQSLSDNGIQTYLDGMPGMTSVWQTIHNRPAIKAVIGKPIFLNMLAVAYQDDISPINDFATLSEGAIKDRIFNDYIRAQYQRLATSGDTRFSLDQVFEILGLVATRGVIRYGTGRVAMVEVNQPHWDDLLIVDDLRFGFLGNSSPHSADFLDFARQLNLITSPQEGIGSCTFVHPTIRDLLVVRHCLPVAEKLTGYTIESLMRINDPRKYDAFAEVLGGNYKLNYKLQAFAALDSDPSKTATAVLEKLSATLNHDFFADRIRMTLSKRQRG